MIIRCKHPDVVIPDISFHELMLKTIKKFDDKTALIDGETAEKLTYRQIHEYSKKLSASLWKLGLGKGDILAALLPNCLEYLVIYIATTACGATFTTCNPTYTEAEITNQLKLSRPKFIVVQKNNFLMMQNIVKTVTSIKNIIPNEYMQGVKSIRKLINDGNLKDFPNVTIDCNKDLCILPYSSGTTGLSKGVMLTHRNIVSGLVNMQDKISDYDTIVYCVLPFFHAYGFLVITTWAKHGATMVVHKRFSLDSMYKSIDTYKITYLPLVPPIIVAINNNPIPSKYDLSSLKITKSGAAPISPGILNKVGKKLNTATSSGWALTEAVPLCSLAGVTAPTKSCGVIGRNTKLKIVDPDTGNELGPNMKGELCVKGPQVMLGYYNNEIATKKAIDKDGWLHTGDVGYFDENEFIFVVDRIKELIKYKGFQVAPGELEELLSQHPKVADCAVTGIPDKNAGEVPKAFVVKKDQSLTPAEIHNFVKGKLSSYKYLRGGVEFVDHIPKGDTGKILRRELKRREMAKSRL